MKRTIQELSDYKDLFDSLLSTIRLANADQLSEVTAIIRNNVPMKDIAHAVSSPVTNFPDSKTSSTSNSTMPRDGSHRLGSPLSEQFVTKSRLSSELNLVPPSPEYDGHIEYPRAVLDPYARISLESLCDIPPYRVPAKPWTEATDDNDLVSHLVSLYFTWDHPCAQFVDQGIFLEHMRRGDLDSEFCSPLLVNSLLSMASVCGPSFYSTHS